LLAVRRSTLGSIDSNAWEHSPLHGKELDEDESHDEPWDALADEHGDEADPSLRPLRPISEPDTECECDGNVDRYCCTSQHERRREMFEH
jgi:hypothetical protein